MVLYSCSFHYFQFSGSSTINNKAVISAENPLDQHNENEKTFNVSNNEAYGTAAAISNTEVATRPRSSMTTDVTEFGMVPNEAY